MSKKSNTITMSAEELNNIIAQAVAQALAQEKAKKATGKIQPKAEKVEYTNAKGETKLITRKQAENYASRKHTDEEKAAWKAKREKALADFESNREGYKPSKDLIEAIKRDRASITRQVAKEQYGFVGTKKDLQALKAEVLSK